MINTKMMLVFLSVLMLMVAQPLLAQGEQEGKRWAISGGLGGVTLSDASVDGEPYYLNDDEGMYFHLSADYYLTPRLAFTGGLYLERDGMMCDASNGMGFKQVNMMGVQGGAKLYIFPEKWIVQPYVGAMLQTNVLNLGKRQGKGIYTAEQAYPGSRFSMEWDVQSPGLSAVPRIGVDIHLFSTVSLNLDYGLAIGLWGHQRYNVTYLDGPLMGMTTHRRNALTRPYFQLGLKMDFPTRRISNRAWNNLLLLIHSWIASKSYR